MPTGQPDDPRLKEVHRYLTEQLGANKLPSLAFKRMSDALLMGDQALRRVRELEVQLATLTTGAGKSKGA